LDQQYWFHYSQERGKAGAVLKTLGSMPPQKENVYGIVVVAMVVVVLVVLLLS